MSADVAELASSTLASLRTDLAEFITHPAPTGLEPDTT